MTYRVAQKERFILTDVLRSSVTELFRELCKVSDKMFSMSAMLLHAEVYERYLQHVILTVYYSLFDVGRCSYSPRKSCYNVLYHIFHH